LRLNIVANMKRGGIKSIILDLTGSGLGIVNTFRTATQQRCLSLAVSGFQ